MLEVRLTPHRAFLRADDSAPQKLFVLLRLVPQVSTRPPLCLAFVLDTSLSMRAFVDQEAASRLARSGAHATGTSQDGAQYRSLDAKLPTFLDRAIEAAHGMADNRNLQGDDCVSIIHFDDDARALFPLAPLQDKAALHLAIDRLRGCAGQTQMGKGLQVALDEMKKLFGAAARRVFVFTDGSTQDEAACRALSTRFAGLNAPIIALGFGPEYNADLMRELSDATAGRAYHLTDIQELKEILEREIGFAARESITDVQLEIASVRGARLEKVHRVYPNVGAVLLSSPLRLGNVEMEQGASFVLEWTIEGLARNESKARLAQLSFQARVPGNEMLGIQTQSVALPMQNLIVEFTSDEKQLARVNDEVLRAVQSRNAASLAQNAASSHDASAARQHLQNALKLSSKSGNERATQMLGRALDELDQTGNLSPDTRRTVALGAHNKTPSPIGASTPSDARGGLSDDEIRHLSGT